MGKIGIGFLFLLAWAALAPAQDYDGPIPDKPDIPYLLHASNLVETEVGEARTEERKDETVNIMDGAASPGRWACGKKISLGGPLRARQTFTWRWSVRS